MLTSNDYATAARIIRNEAGVQDAARAGVIAADLDQLAQAGNGYGSVETLHATIVLDSDRDLAARRHEILQEVQEDAPENEESNIIGREAYIGTEYADRLKDWCEELCGLEGVDEHDVPEPSDMAGALLRCAISSVDWIGLAKHYIEQEQQG